MGIKTIATDRFLRWLDSQGLVYIRTKGSHDHFNYPERDPRRLTRTITIRTKYKDIPLLHIHTTLKTLGISKKEFEKQIREF